MFSSFDIVLLVVLFGVCLEYWRRHKSYSEMMFHSDTESSALRGIAREQAQSLQQVGELFDHIGVSLEGSKYLRASNGLKLLGKVLRQQEPGSDVGVFLLNEELPALEALSRAYSMPIAESGVVRVRKLIQLAEEILESVVAEGSMSA